MRRKVIAGYMVGLILLFLWISNYSIQLLPNEILIYYKNHYFADTSAQNAVTAIYLNYRVFDTLFEALMLLISVIGIIHFSRHEGGM
jgi:multicomponent Na+:H+ antiporter subunit B